MRDDVLDEFSSSWYNEYQLATRTEQLSGEVEGVLRRDRIISEANVLTRYGLDIVDELIWGERAVDDVRCAV